VYEQIVHLDSTRKTELYACETPIQKQYEGKQTMTGTDTDFDHNIPVAKVCTRLKKIVEEKQDGICRR
jgi:hypothetical protein